MPVNGESADQGMSSSATSEVSTEPPECSPPSRSRWRSLTKYVLDPRRIIHKYFLLMLICLFIPGPYFLDSFLGSYKGPISDSMQLSNAQFGLLFAVSSLTGILCGPAGVAISRVGRTAVAMGAGLMCALGALFTVFGFKWKLLPVMLAARFVFWLSLYFMMLVQTLLLYSIFKGQALVVAYSLLVMACRLGGVFGYFLSGPMLSKYGLEGALWFSVATVMVAFAATLLFAFLFRGSATATSVRPLLQRRRSSLEGSSAQVKELSLSLFWELPRSIPLVTLCIGGLYGCVFPFEVIADDMLQNTFGYNASDAGYLLTVIPAVPLFSPLLTPVLRGVRRKFVSLAVGLTSIIVAQLLLYTLRSWSPSVSFVLMGCGFATSVCSIWTILPALVQLEAPENSVKAIQELATCLGYTALAICQFLSNTVVGVLKDKFSYRAVFVWLAASAVVALVSALFAFAVRPAGADDALDSEDGDNESNEVEVQVSVPDDSACGGQIGADAARKPPHVQEDYYA